MADGIGDIESILKSKFGKQIKIKIIEQKKSFIQKKISSSIDLKNLNFYDIIDAFEEKSYWSRFGM